MSDKYEKRKIQSSSVTTVISLSLVLFMLGLLGLLVLSAKKISDHFKENIGFQIYLKDEAKEAEVRQLQKILDAKQYVKSSEYISKEQAYTIYREQVGDDYADVLDYNPLPASIELRLNAQYANADSIVWIKKEIMDHSSVKEFNYRETLVDLINKRVGTISLYFLIFIALLMVIALALINNTIRLTIYSKRFIIRTMQLVGATQSFIRKPFIINGMVQGFYAAIIAIGLLTSVIYIALNEIPDFLTVVDMQLILSLFGMVIAAGILISGISITLAVRKYLLINFDDLYN
jgi:cell division transport system permease protein